MLGLAKHLAYWEAAEIKSENKNGKQPPSFTYLRLFLKGSARLLTSAAGYPHIALLGAGREGNTAVFGVDFASLWNNHSPVQT